MEVVIIGASFGGISAAIHARKHYPKATITLIDRKNRIGYIPSGLHAYLNRQIRSLEEAYFITEKELTAQDIDVRLDTSVYEVDEKEKRVLCQSGETQTTISYDKLILASGSDPASQKIPGSQCGKVLTYKSHAQAEHTLEQLQHSNHIAVIGGGQAGIEAADALHAAGKQVTVIESMDTLMFKSFDAEMLKPLVNEMSRSGVNVRLNTAVTDIQEQEEQLVLEAGTQTIRCDAALMSTNVRPDLGYLGEQFATHMDGTLEVDEYLRTSDPDVFAVGDCIQTTFSLTGESFYMPLANNAVRTGIVAAENLSAPMHPYPGSLRTFGTRVFGYYAASTGMTEADTLFYDRPIATHTFTAKMNLLPGAGTVTVKYVADAQDKRLLGVQLISKENILPAINTFALAIQNGQTIDSLREKEYFFQAGFTNLVDFTNLTDFLL